VSRSAPRTLFQPLRGRPFRLFWIGQTTSAYGDQVFIVALALQVLRLGGGARQLGLVNAGYGASLVLFSLVGGLVVDRVGRRSVLVASDLARMLVMGWAGAASLAGSLRIGSMAAAALLYGAADAFFWPAKTALLPTLVGREQLLPANSLASAAIRSSLILGPGLGGVLVATAGPGVAFLFDAATFALSAGCLLAIGRTDAPPAPEEAAVPEAPRRLLDDLREGVAEVTRHRWLWVTILLFTFIVLLVLGPEEVLLPVFLAREFDAADAYGLVLACAGVGAVGGALLIGVVRPVHRGLWGYGGAILSACALACYGLANGVWQLAVLAMVWGGGLESLQVVWDTSLQELVRPEALGRVSSLDVLGSLALLPVSFALVGAVADRFGARPVFGVAGLGAAALLAVGLLVPEVRGYRTES
jgi:MFS family permease